MSFAKSTTMIMLTATSQLGPLIQKAWIDANEAKKLLAGFEPGMKEAGTRKNDFCEVHDNDNVNCDKSKLTQLGRKKLLAGIEPEMKEAEKGYRY